MAGMPHVVETGPLFSKLADRYSAADVPTRLGLLTHLYNNPLVVPDGGNLNSGAAPIPGSMEDPALDPLAAATPTESTRTSHVNTHWFGLNMLGGLPVPRQPAGVTNTGWWNKWRGDAHGIMRETLIRALEVSLGLEHLGGAPDTIDEEITPTRCWQIHFLWVCGSPKFEGWLHWRKNVGDAPDGGVVTVVFSTPGNSESPLSLTLLPEDDPAGDLLTDGDPYERVGQQVDGVTNVYDIETDWAGYHHTDAIGKGPLAVAGDQSSATLQTDRGLVVIGHARTLIERQSPGGGASALQAASEPGSWVFGGFGSSNNPNDNVVGANEWLDGSASPLVCVAPESANDGGQLPWPV